MDEQIALDAEDEEVEDVFDDVAEFVRGAYHHTIDEEMADPSGASAASSSGNA